MPVVYKYMGVGRIALTRTNGWSWWSSLGFSRERSFSPLFDQSANFAYKMRRLILILRKLDVGLGPWRRSAGRTDKSKRIRPDGKREEGCPPGSDLATFKGMKMMIVFCLVTFHLPALAQKPKGVVKKPKKVERLNFAGASRGKKAPPSGAQTARQPAAQMRPVLMPKVRPQAR